jgi:hypothetical protein
MTKRPVPFAARTASLAPALVLVLTLALSACAGPWNVQPGQTQAEVQSLYGPPTGRYALPGGGTRLEYATGPFGRHTWMFDIGTDGRVVAANQVLNERSFLVLAERIGAEPGGLPAAEVLATIGRPGERRRVGWTGGETWSWRYPTNDCLWFQVSVTPQGQATSAGYGIDPTCDAPSDARH